jgi:5-(carboxyamino)imidazole ribonucleotide mutase
VSSIRHSPSRTSTDLSTTTKEMSVAEPLVGIVMGSDSDWPVMEPAARALDEFEVGYEVHVVSAHRTPRRMLEYAESAVSRGLRVIVAGAGGAAHLPGMIAAATPIPVIGVPRPLDRLDGLDSLLSIVQMPAGVPVATVSIGGGRNAGLLAVRILGAGDPRLLERMAWFQARMAEQVLSRDTALQQQIASSAG